jgi:uncharacterized protein (DUF2141 family)
MCPIVSIMECEMIMKFIRLVSFLAALILAPGFAAFGQQPPTAAGQVVVRVTGLGSTKAPVRIAVYNSEKAWLNEASVLYRTILDGETSQVEWKIENVPYGEYAVAAFQDANANGELDRNVLGMPKEPYGFSNDARGILGPASWAEAKVRVTSPVTELTVELK